MNNPFKNKKTFTDEDAKRVVAITQGFESLVGVLLENSTVPSRYHSVCITLLEQAHAMAVKSVNESTDVLP